MAKKKKRKLKPIKLDKKGEFYIYKTGLYVRQKLDDDKDCKTYRIKPVKDGVKLLVCITKKKGPRGGRTKAVALLRPVNVDLRRYAKRKDKSVYRAIKKARKLKQKLEKDK